MDELSVVILLFVFFYIQQKTLVFEWDICVCVYVRVYCVRPPR